MAANGSRMEQLETLQFNSKISTKQSMIDGTRIKTHSTTKLHMSVSTPERHARNSHPKS
ncbi:hypothetical protein CCACVL1_04892 [Corchorus capsularis]|uniref:Uncharacterized protein n=1 Tax=Corchorus capsularis TaxID=210143 RepID=A0A1R3JNV6_COCAP|nr:hypothetical protein CCACVL1_04892 [Corchorus capsularis]